MICTPKTCPGLPYHDPALCAYIDAGHPVSQWYNPYPLGIWSLRDQGVIAYGYRELYDGKEGAD